MARRGDAIYRRGNTWWLDTRIDGRRYQVRLGKGIRRTVAAELAAVERAKILKGEAGMARRRKDATFDDAARLFLEWSEANRRPHSVTMHRAAIRKLSAAFGGKRLSQITTFAVEGYKRRRGAEARVRVNRELATLKSLFYRMIEWGKYDGPNPVRGVKLLPEPKRRLRFLEPDEEERFLAAASEPLRTILLVGMHAGLRIQSEALTLTWGAVDLERGFLTVLDAHAKNATSRSVPLNSKLRAALAELKARARSTRPDDPVFVGPRSGEPLKSIRTAFDTARKKAGLGPDVTPHTLRHTFASRLVMAGVDLRTVQELGGWKKLEMVMRYAHLSPGHQAEAVERLVAGKPAVLESGGHGDEGRPELEKRGIISLRNSLRGDDVSS